MRLIRATHGLERRRSILFLLCLWSLLLGLPTGSARSRTAGQTRQAVRERAVKATAEGAQAVAQKDFATAYKILADAYREYPNAETLYQLGQLAQAEGRTLDAQDLLRRYLADPGVDASSANAQVAQRLVEQPRGLSGELSVTGEQGVLVLLDGRVVGVLPLGQTLLLTPGAHQVGLESDGKVVSSPLEIKNGKTSELRFNADSKAMLLTIPPALLLMGEYGGLTTELTPRLLLGYDRAARRAGLALFRSDSAAKAIADATECIESLDCREKLARRLEVEYLLLIKLSSGGAAIPSGASAPVSVHIELSLFDVETGDVTARAERDCLTCGVEQVAMAVVTASELVISSGTNREKGRVAIQSDPPGAALVRDGRIVGQTPYEHVALSGQYEAELRLAGHQSERIQLRVTDGKRAEFRALLRVAETEPDPSPARTSQSVVGDQNALLQRQPRPTWRLALGGILTGTGVLIGGFGVSALAVDGSCAQTVPQPQICPEFYNTGQYAAGLLPTGIGLTITGIILLALPGPRAAAPSPR